MYSAKTENRSQSMIYGSIAANTMSDDNLDIKKRRRATMRKLTKMVDVTEEEAVRLSYMPEEKKQEVIEELKGKIKRYQFLMLMIAVNSGWRYYTTNMLVFYNKNILNLTAAQSSQFNSFTFLPWSFKPIYGFFLDSIYLFGYKFKGHCLTMALLTSLVIASIIIVPKPGLQTLTVILFLHNLTCSYIDSLAQGMTARLTKLNQKLAALEETEDGESSLKSFGLYNSLKALSRTIMIFIGGYVVENTESTYLMVSGFILASYPLLIFFVTLFVFKDEKQPTIFRGCGNFIEGVKKTLKALFTREALLPLAFLVFYRMLPQMNQVYTYILLTQGGWSFDLFNISNFIEALIVNVDLLFGFKKIGKYIKYNILVVLSLLMIALSILLSSSVLISQDLPHIPYAAFWTLTVALSNLSYALILVTVVSRISRLLPEGFESTGVTMIISTSNISFSFGQYFSSVLADSYGV